MRPADRFLVAFAADLVAAEVAPGDPELAERTCAWVLERVRGAGDVTRLGLGAAGLALSLAVRAATGRAYDRLDPQRRRRIAARLAASRLPVAGEYVRAVRALAVTYAYEQRL